MNISSFLRKLNDQPRKIEFNETMEVIDANFHYAPTTFDNGNIQNQKQQNEGSCKLLYFAQLQGLDKAHTVVLHQYNVVGVLACFGRYYRDDVLAHPDGHRHQNIRNFIDTGWAGIKYYDVALSRLKKSENA